MDTPLNIPEPITKAQLIKQVALKFTHLPFKDVETAVRVMLEHMAQTLANGDRIEIRGFGSFSLHYRPARMARNPKTGAPLSLPGKHVPHFKPGKVLSKMVNGQASR